MIKMVVDTMGSDKGSKATVAGIIKFLETHKDVEIIAVGKIEELEELKKYENVTLVDARDIVPMEAGALEVMRMRGSSMMVAINKFLEVKVDAIVSAGSTGGFLSATTLKLKLIEGVERAALVSPFPTLKQGKYVTILDIGASNENTPEQLVQFAHMGKIYANKIFHIEQPKVYLLSNGAEDEKGSPLIKETHKMLRTQNMEGFQGNIEARYALKGDADVIVTGGFDGNVFLKAVEGTASMMNTLIKKAFKKNIFTKIGYLFAKSGFDDFKKTMDYKSYGGALFLGVKKPVVKAHGSSDEILFEFTIKQAEKFVENKAVDKMIEEFEKNSAKT